MYNIRKCEICSNRFLEPYGYSLTIQWLVTGHAHVPAFLCHETQGSGQHWGCSPQHAWQAAERCLNSHMALWNIEARHGGAAYQGALRSVRFSEEDRVWAEKRGEDFHIIKDRNDLLSILDDTIGDW